MLNKLKLVDDTRIERLIRCCILLGLCVTLAGVIIVMLLHSFQDKQMISCKTDTCRKISKLFGVFCLSFFPKRPAK